MHANDNEPAYFAQAELDRALVLEQRLRTIRRHRRRALAAGKRPPAPLGHELRPSDWHYQPRPRFAWPRHCNGFGIFNLYGLALVATLVLCLGTLHVVQFVIGG